MTVVSETDDGWQWTTRDEQLVEQDLGRSPRDVIGVAARCRCGHPLVVATKPRLADGTPFPTFYYMTDAALVAACSTLEAGQVMVDYNQALAADPQLQEAYRAAHEHYLAARDDYGEVPEIAGISAGGMPSRVKCLHALVGHSLAAGPGANPIGDLALEELSARGLWSLDACSHADDPRPVAAIDCGTNSIRLLIARVQGNDVVDLEREMVITRLGQGVDHTGELDPEAIARTLEAAAGYAAQIRQADVAAARFVTTSASRDAVNRDDFLVPAEEITGLIPTVLSGKEEAELSFRGALSALPSDLPKPYLLVDIGGGSTEFVLGVTNAQQAVSVDMGSVRVTERFGSGGWDADALEQARQFIDRQIAVAEQTVDFGAVKTLVGVAGTVTTLAALIAGVQEYDPSKTHGLRPDTQQWREAVDFMVEQPVEVKAALPIMPPGRADVIAGGALIWEQILNRFGVLGDSESQGVEVVVSEHDILDGLVLSLA